MNRYLNWNRWVWVASLLVPMAASGAEPLKPFAVPGTLDAWESRRAEIKKAVVDAIDFHRGAGPGSKAASAFHSPTATNPGQRFPAVLLLADQWPEGSTVTNTAPDQDRRVEELIGRGFAVLAARSRPINEVPWIVRESAAKDEPSLPDLLRDDRAALDDLLNREQVDPARVAVVGAGVAATRAWWLMALDDRIACGVAMGGITRLSDWQTAQGGNAYPLAPWAKTLLASFDTEAIMALCAPRHLQIFEGDRDPFAPESGYKILRNTSQRVQGLYRGKSQGLSHTLFGGFGAGVTLLEWDATLETLDKAFLPQRPGTLGHAPEPEPVVDDRFINPAQHSIAGWVAEMSQRPGTWTWDDGLIRCEPGKNEYGWLRMPVELDDFIFQVEWKVPPRGNTGIFLRAKPVPWFVPPGEKGKERVSTLGLEWPSRTGLELQAQDDPGIADKYSSGSLYRHAAPSENLTKPPGQWNRYTVRARGPRIEVWSNGKQVLDTNLDDHPSLRHPPLRGYLGLQNHGVGAEFRNIRYLPLETQGASENAR